MNFIDEKVVLDFYLMQMEQGNIQFLQGSEKVKERIKENVEQLKYAVDMHDKIQIAKNLWKALFEASMSYIDPDRRGYDELFAYFDEYVNFEELIFASDSFYRDHTLHCLWVYFLGEYLKKADKFNDLFSQLDSQIRNIVHLSDILKQSSIAPSLQELFGFTSQLDVLKYDDSVWCISALTHDLGYPIKKVYKINHCIGKVLPYFALQNYNEFNFSYSSSQQEYIKSFIKFMTISISVTSVENKKVQPLLSKIFITDEKENLIGINEKELAILSQEEIELLVDGFNFKSNILEDVSLRLQYFNDFEQYQHGIMSAFLLMKTIKAFSNTAFLYTDNINVKSEHIDFKGFLTKMSILKAISNHTNEAKQITGIYAISDVLILIDELEEFSRISRANMNRQFIEEFCKSNINFEEGVLQIDFIFDNENIKNLDPEKAFKGRCKRFLSLFNISKLDEQFKIKLSCIGRLPYDGNIYTLEIGKQYANITINGVDQDIPKYLKSSDFYTKEMYMKL
jgi:hypothetical protein